MKYALTSAPILITSDWSQPFKLMCDSSNVAVEAMLGQKKDKVIHLIYYVNKTLNKARENFTTIEKELLAIILTIEKFRSYIVGFKVTVHNKDKV